VHANNLVMRLRILSYSFYKLCNIALMKVICTVYLALYQSTIQYGLLIWGGLLANALKPLLIHQKQIVCICLHKSYLEASTITNSKLFNVLLVDLLLRNLLICVTTNFW